MFHALSARAHAFASFLCVLRAAWTGDRDATLLATRVWLKYAWRVEEERRPNDADFA